MEETTQITDAETLKNCCASLYQSEWARLLLGDSFHPGGLALTERLGNLLNLRPGQRLLDVAAGRGASAIFLARRFGCQVVGVDYGAAMVAQANARAQEAGLDDVVRFEVGDAEGLRFAGGEFDAVLCECAFCTFPDKAAASAEFARVLRPGGRLGLSDLTRAGPLPPELETMLGWIACLADARPLDEYLSYLAAAGLVASRTERHDGALSDMLRAVQTRLLGAEVLVKLQKLELPGADFEQAKALARSAVQTVQRGRLGYALIVATLSEETKSVR